MVLSNKKLKQQIRAAKAELLAKSEAEKKFISNGLENPGSQGTRAGKSALDTVAQKPKLSKREKRREKAQSLQKNAEKEQHIATGNGLLKANKLEKESEDPNEQNSSKKKKKKKRKRKRDEEGDDCGEQVEVKKVKVKKQEKIKKMGDKKTENGAVKEDVEHRTGTDGDVVLEVNKLKNESEDLNEQKSSKKRKKKRKRDEEGEDCEEHVEVKQVKKKKQKKVKKKGNKKAGNGAVKEEVEQRTATDENHEEKNAMENYDSKQNLDTCKKVYVGGIPYYSTEDDIRSFFESCGTITEVDCMKFPESGKFRGIAIITFKTDAAAKRALAFDGSDMGGLFLKVMPYKSASVTKVSNFTPQIIEGYNRIYVGNLSWDITEDDLRKFFSGCKIKSIRFGEDKETGEFRGYAHVDFADNLSLNMALKLDQKVVGGRPARITCAVAKKGSTNAKPGKKSDQVNNDVKTGSANAKPEMKSDQGNNHVKTVVKAEEIIANAEKSVPEPVVSGKIRRRTCYECGERGHLSSSCPNKQVPDQINPDIS